MSSSATSGCEACAAATTSSPREHWATTSMSSSSAEQRGERAADHALVLGEQHADHAAASGNVRLQPEAAAFARAGIDAPAGCADSLAQPVQSAATGVRDPADTIVDDRHRESGVVRGERDLAVMRAAVAQHVGDAFAHRPGEQAVDRRRRDGRVARDVEGDARRRRARRARPAARRQASAAGSR